MIGQILVVGIGLTAAVLILCGAYCIVRDALAEGSEDVCPRPVTRDDSSRRRVNPTATSIGRGDR